MSLVACGGDSCTGCSGLVDAPYPNPPAAGGAIQNDVVRARLTQNLLNFLQRHITEVVQSFFTVNGDKAFYYIDEGFASASSPVAFRDGCLGEPDSPCTTPTWQSNVSLDLVALENNLHLQWLDADSSGRPGLRLSLDNIDIFADMVIAITTDLLPNAACRIRDAGQLAALHADSFGFDLRFSMSNAPNPIVTVSVENLVTDLSGASDADVLNMDVTACDGIADSTCTDPAFLGPDCTNPSDPDACQQVCGLLDVFGQLGGFLGTVLQPILDGVSNELADSIASLFNEALVSLPLNLETQTSFAEMAPAIFGNTRPLFVKLAASSNLAVTGTSLARGLDLGVDGGVTVTTPPPCIQNIVTPDFSNVLGPPPNYNGFVERLDANGLPYFEPYHMVISVSEALFAQAGWAALQTGALCLTIDSQAIADTAGGTFGLTAGTLMSFDARLAGITDSDAPVLVALRPTTSPYVRVGAGQLVAPGIEDPLLELSINDAAIDIYIFIDEALTRISGRLSDFVVQMGIDRTPDHKVELNLEKVGFSDFLETYNEIVPASDLSDLFELVVDLAVTRLLGGNLSLDFEITDALSTALGVPLELRLNAIRRDFGPTHAPYLSVYATLCGPDDIANSNNTACYTPPPALRLGLPVPQLVEESAYVPSDTNRFPEETWLAMPSGAITFKVNDPHADTLEYQFRVDNGLWSTYKAVRQGEFVINSPRLRVLGQHHIELRGRYSGAYTSRGTSIPYTLWIDRERPQLFVEQQGDYFLVHATDIGSPQQINLWSRERDSTTSGPWTACEGTVPLNPNHGLEIVAIDAAGNESLPFRYVPQAGSRLPTIAKTDPTPGCHALNVDPQLVLFFGVLALFRRFRNH